MHRSLISNQPLGSKVSLPTVLNCTVRRHEHYPILPWVSRLNEVCYYAEGKAELPCRIKVHACIAYIIDLR